MVPTYPVYYLFLLSLLCYFPGVHFMSCGRHFDLIYGNVQTDQSGARKGNGGIPRGRGFPFKSWYWRHLTGPPPKGKENIPNSKTTSSYPICVFPFLLIFLQCTRGSWFFHSVWKASKINYLVGVLLVWNTHRVAPLTRQIFKDIYYQPFREKTIVIFFPEPYFLTSTYYSFISTRCITKIHLMTR